MQMMSQPYATKLINFDTPGALIAQANSYPREIDTILAYDCLLDFDFYFL